VFRSFVYDSASGHAGGLRTGATVSDPGEQGKCYEFLIRTFLARGLCGVEYVHFRLYQKILYFTWMKISLVKIFLAKLSVFTRKKNENITSLLMNFCTNYLIRNYRGFQRKIIFQEQLFI
jgi:hypothetical protein